MDTTTEIAATGVEKVNKFFGGIDFDGLNGTIEALSHADILTESEKSAAREVISSWNDNVIKKLEEKRDDIKTFVDCISINSYIPNGVARIISTGIFQEEVELLAAEVGVSGEFNALVIAVKDYEMKLAEQRAMREPEIGPDVTQAEAVILKKDYTLERMTMDAEIRKVSNEIVQLNKVILTAFNGNGTIQKLIRELNKRARAMGKMEQQCTDKANLAKINVSISDAETKEALKDLISFGV